MSEPNAKYVMTRIFKKGIIDGEIKLDERQLVLEIHTLTPLKEEFFDDLIKIINKHTK